MTAPAAPAIKFSLFASVLIVSLLGTLQLQSHRRRLLAGDGSTSISTSISNLEPTLQLFEQDQFPVPHAVGRGKNILLSPFAAFKLLALQTAVSCQGSATRRTCQSKGHEEGPSHNVEAMLV
mmetsp:Transcript_96941/g.269710  ORF Transcript_96941/g.269710 Transcript_96941/m.269710 type:complete len:122 (+) Transcript_96941:1273-1638(+)